MSASAVTPGDPLFVPASERAQARALGAFEEPGDGRMFVPRPLPPGIRAENFAAWVGLDARLRWVSEVLSDTLGANSSLADLVELEDRGRAAEDRVALYVPRSEANTARAIPGVRWDRRLRQFTASHKADFGLVFPYLTPAARATWMADRAMDAAAASMVRAAAIRGSEEDGDQRPEMMRLDTPRSGDDDAGA